MSHYCQKCEHEFFDSSDMRFYKDLVLCSDCVQWFEEHDGYDGKLVVEKCKECGTLKDWDFVLYKKRGRPKGSENKPKTGGNSLKNYGEEGK